MFDPYLGIGMKGRFDIARMVNRGKSCARHSHFERNLYGIQPSLYTSPRYQRYEQDEAKRTGR